MVKAKFLHVRHSTEQFISHCHWLEMLTDLKFYHFVSGCAETLCSPAKYVCRLTKMQIIQRESVVCISLSDGWSIKIRTVFKFKFSFNKLGPKLLKALALPIKQIYINQHNIKTTCLIFCWFTICWTIQALDSARPPKVCCGTWSQDVSSRSFKFCKLQGGGSIDQICLVSLAYSTDAQVICNFFGIWRLTPQSHCCAPQHFSGPFLLCGRMYCPAKRVHSQQEIPLHGLQWCFGMWHMSN